MIGTAVEHASKASLNVSQIVSSGMICITIYRTLKTSMMSDVRQNADVVATRSLSSGFHSLEHLPVCHRRPFVMTSMNCGMRRGSAAPARDAQYLVQGCSDQQALIQDGFRLLRQLVDFDYRGRAVNSIFTKNAPGPSRYICAMAVPIANRKTSTILR